MSDIDNQNPLTWNILVVIPKADFIYQRPGITSAT